MLNTDCVFSATLLFFIAFNPALSSDFKAKLITVHILLNGIYFLSVIFRTYQNIQNIREVRRAKTNAKK